MKPFIKGLSLLLVSFIFLLLGTTVVSAASYYVDATGGDDGNAGTSTTAAWKTVNQVNDASLSSGDYVYFKKGETWTLTEGLTAVSGVYYTSYGTGDKPILDGNDAVDVFLASGKSNVTIDGLEIRNALDFGIGFGKSGSTSASDGVIKNCEVSGSGNDNIIIIDGSHDISVTNVETYDAYRRIADGRTVTGIEIADEAYNITVDNITSYGNATAGISVHGHSGEGFPYNLTIRNSSFYSNVLTGIYLVSNSAVIPADPNIVFENCSSYSNTNGAADGTGITVTNDGGATYVTDVTFKNCAIYSNNSVALYLKGDSIEFQNCYFSGRAPTVVSSIGTTFYNNTIYNTAAVASMTLSGARMANFVMKNNIIRQTIAGQVAINVNAGSGVTGYDINYNLYKTPGTAASTHWYWLGSGYNWANWKLNTAMDANSIAPADPLWVDPANRDFRLGASSTAINAGVDVGLDYSGTAPDLGAYEYAVANAPTALSQSISGRNLTFSFSMTSLDPTDTLTPSIEIQPVGTAFTNTANYSGSAVSYAGSAVTGTVTVGNFGSGKFHWQAIIGNYVGNSSWTSYGGNLETVSDFEIAYDLPGVTACSESVPGSVPRIYSAVSQDNASIILSFTQSTQPVSKYMIQYGVESGKYIYAVDNVDKNVSTYMVKSLQLGKTYYFKIAAANGCAASAWSDEISAKTSGGTGTYETENEELQLDEPSEDENANTLTQEGTSLKVKVLDKNGQPLEGVKMVLHSDVQETVTNDEGIAEFSNVESGEHRVIISYNNYEGEKTINVSKEEKEVDMEITIEAKKVIFSSKATAAIVIGLIAVIVILLILLRRKN